MSDLAAAAQTLGAPEALVQRSAEARAKATGGSVDEILAAWASGGMVAAPAPPQPATAATPTATPATSPALSPPSAEPQSAPSEMSEEESTSSATAVIPPAPVPLVGPERVGPREALSHPVVVSVPTAGLTERTATALPLWMAMAFMIVPTFGLLHLAGNLGGQQCVEGGIELAIDRATGTVENCDGTEFEGRQTGGAGGEFIAQGEAIYTSAGCTGCHGPGGAGQGQFPPLGGVLTTFLSCADHIRWVSLGSDGTLATGASTYGDLATPIRRGMPSFGARLSEEQLASAAAFERVRFGGGNPDEVLADCGLAQPAEGAVTDGSTPEGSTPEGSTPEGSTPEGSAPPAGDTTDTTVGG